MNQSKMSFKKLFLRYYLEVSNTCLGFGIGLFISGGLYLLANNLKQGNFYIASSLIFFPASFLISYIGNKIKYYD